MLLSSFTDMILGCFTFHESLSDESKGDFESFPDDVLIAIFCLLPVRTIVQCRIVCRRWRNLTSSSLFVELKFQMAEPQVLLRYRMSGSTEFFPLITDEATRKLAITPVCRNLMRFMNDQGSTLNPAILSSCNGFLLYKTTRNSPSYFIFNPVTNENFAVPWPPYWTLCGFFFHPSTRELRVLHFMYRCTKRHYRYRIYTLGRENNSWRSLSCISCRCPFSKDPIVVNGRLHWFADGLVTKDFCENFILRFDMNSEVMDFIPHPEHDPCSWGHQKVFGPERPEYTGYDYRNQLAEVDGELCLCHLPRKQSVVIDLWTFMAEKQWIKRYRINLSWDFRYYSFAPGTVDNCYVKILRIWKNELIFHWHRNGLFRYNFETGCVYKIEMEGKSRDWDELKLVPVNVYKESLFSLRHFLEV